MRKLYIAMAALAASLSIAAAANAAPAPSAPVLLFNPTNNDCGAGYDSASYSGSGTLMIDSYGTKLYTCHGSLISGSAPAQTYVLRGPGFTWVFTPAGTFSVTLTVHA